MGRWALFLLLALPLAAQVNTADILGTATDTSGAALPRVQVTVENLSTNLQRRTLTGDDGNYILTLLPAGRYRVRAEQTGFNTYQAPQVVIAAGDRVRLDLRLEVGAVEQSVEVEAALDRIEAGSYGLCESCEGAIGRLRLRAIPEARLCMTCSARNVA